jgi:hypothetical protein
MDDSMDEDDDVFAPPKISEIVQRRVQFENRSNSRAASANTPITVNHPGPRFSSKTKSEQHHKTVESATMALQRYVKRLDDLKTEQQRQERERLSSFQDSKKSSGVLSSFRSSSSSSPTTPTVSSGSSSSSSSLHGAATSTPLYRSPITTRIFTQNLASLSKLDLDAEYTYNITGACHDIEHTSLFHLSKMNHQITTMMSGFRKYKPLSDKQGITRLLPHEFEAKFQKEFKLGAHDDISHDQRRKICKKMEQIWEPTKEARFDNFGLTYIMFFFDKPGVGDFRDWADMKVITDDGRCIRHVIIIVMGSKVHLRLSQDCYKHNRGLEWLQLNACQFHTHPSNNFMWREFRKPCASDAPYLELWNFYSFLDVPNITMTPSYELLPPGCAAAIRHGLKMHIRKTAGGEKGQMKLQPEGPTILFDDYQARLCGFLIGDVVVEDGTGPPQIRTCLKLDDVDHPLFQSSEFIWTKMPAMLAQLQQQREPFDPVFGPHYSSSSSTPSSTSSSSASFSSSS